MVGIFEELVVQEHLLGDLGAGLEDEIGQLCIDGRSGLGMHPPDLDAHPVDDDLRGLGDGVVDDQRLRLGQVFRDGDELHGQGRIGGRGGRLANLCGQLKV